MVFIWILQKMFNRTNVKKTFFYLRNHGVKSLFHRIKEKIRNTIEYEKVYHNWIIKNEPDLEELKLQSMTCFQIEPKISIIVPVFNTKKQYLLDMIESVINQTYSNWELCIAGSGSKAPHLKNILEVYKKNDNRIKVKYLTENRGIAGNSNEALSLAKGNFIALLDHDDTLAPFAVFEVVKAINQNPDVDFIYSDEDKISTDMKKRLEPHFKPDWSPDTLRSYNYITHLTIIKRKLLNKVGWFREGYEGSQDYDLILRATEKAKKIIHIPKILYHWRISESSVAGNPYSKLYAYESAKKALTDHINRIGIKGTVEDGLFLGSYKISCNLNNSFKISIIIPNNDNSKNLARCVKSIWNKSTYRNFEIIIVGNSSSEEKTLKLCKELKKPDYIKFIQWDKPFNLSAVNNYAVNYTIGDVLLFLNNNTKVINTDWMERMLEHVVRREVGVVGAKLHYTDGTVQHAGIIIGIQGVTGYSHRRFPREYIGYNGRIKIVQNLSAVTGACLMTRKDIFEEVRGFDQRYIANLNDVDFCIKIRERGYSIIYTPYAELYHFESKTGGYDNASEEQEMLRRDIKYFQNKWNNLLKKEDPYYNPNLTLQKEDFSIRI